MHSNLPKLLLFAKVVQLLTARLILLVFFVLLFIFSFSSAVFAECRITQGPSGACQRSLEFVGCHESSIHTWKSVLEYSGTGCTVYNLDGSVNFVGYWIRATDYQSDDNDCFCGGTSGAPNLIVPSVAVTPSNPMTGQTTSVTATIKNDGNGETVNSFLVVLTLDCVPSGSCVQLGSQRLTSLAAGAEQNVAFNNLPAISSTGSHTYYVKADFSSEIGETNEDDNVGSIAFNVCGAPNKPTIDNPPVCSNIATPQLTVRDEGGSCYPHDAYFLVESKSGGIYSFAQNNWMYSSLVSLNSQASWNLSSALAQGLYRWTGATKPAGVDTSFMTYSDPSTDFAIDLTKPAAPPNLSVTTGCTGGPGTGTATITWSASSD